jgi:hypothetical protein
MGETSPTDGFLKFFPRRDEPRGNPGPICTTIVIDSFNVSRVSTCASFWISQERSVDNLGLYFLFLPAKSVDWRGTASLPQLPVSWHAFVGPRPSISF